MPPTQPQLQNRLNPTPTTFQLPTQGLFRAAGDNGDAVYKFDSNGVPTAYSIRDPNSPVNNNYGSNLSYLSNYGVDFNSLPTFNKADVDSQLLRQGRVGSNGMPIYNAPGSLSDLIGVQNVTPQTTSQTLNTTPNSVGAAPLTPTTPTLPNSPSAQTYLPGTPQNQGPMSGMASSFGQPTTSAQNPYQPVNPQSTATGGNNPFAGDIANTTATDNEVLQKLFDAFKPTQTETDLQSKLAGMEASRRLSYVNLENQPIAAPFITGQEAAVDKKVNADEYYPTQLLQLEQSKRQGAIDASKAALDYMKPMALPYGAQLVSPTSGATVNPGLFGGATSGPSNFNPSTGLPVNATPQQILGYLSGKGIDTTHYDMPGLINAVQSGKTAEDIAAGRAGVAAIKSAATSGSAYKFNTATQTFQQPNPTTNFGNAGTTVTPPSTDPGSIQQLQSFLVANGYMTQAQMNTGPGIYGPKTQAAYQAYLSGQKPSASTIGTAPASNPSAPSSPLSKLSAGAYTYVTTGEPPPKAGSAQVTQYLNEARQAIPGFNPAIAKANASAIADQTKQQADVTRGITAADSNFKLMTDTFKGKVNDYNSPLANQVNNLVQNKLLGSSDVINFQSAVSTLQTEYATVLGRGGEVTNEVRASAQRVINGNYSLNDLISLHDYIDKEGKNVINSYTTTIQNLASGGAGTSSQSPSVDINALRSKYNY